MCSNVADLEVGRDASSQQRKGEFENCRAVSPKEEICWQATDCRPFTQNRRPVSERRLVITEQLIFPAVVCARRISPAVKGQWSQRFGKAEESSVIFEVRDLFSLQCQPGLSTLKLIPCSSREYSRRVRNPQAAPCSRRFVWRFKQHWCNMILVPGSCSEYNPGASCLGITGVTAL